MDFQLPEEFRMLQDLVARFIKEHVLPLEAERGNYDQYENIRLEVLGPLRDKAKAVQVLRGIKSTDGTAIIRPNAVTNSASAMPAETAPRPPEPVLAMPSNELMMPITVPKSPTKGETEPTDASTPMPALISADSASPRRAISRLAASTGPSPRPSSSS